MKISFHKDPVNIPAVCADLQTHGVVYFHTTRPNFRIVHEEVEASGIRILPLTATSPDDDFYNFILCPDVVDYELLKTEAKVLSAILAWQAQGEPVPYVQSA
jgi:hypothetical protein